MKGMKGKILVKSFIRKLDSVGMRLTRKSFAEMSWEGWRLAKCKLRRLVSMKKRAREATFRLTFGRLKTVR